MQEPAADIPCLCRPPFCRPFKPARLAYAARRFAAAQRPKKQASPEKTKDAPPEQTDSISNSCAVTAVCAAIRKQYIAPCRVSSGAAPHLLWVSHPARRKAQKKPPSGGRRQCLFWKLSQQVQCSQSQVLPTWMVSNSQWQPSTLNLHSETPHETPQLIILRSIFHLLTRSICAKAEKLSKTPLTKPSSFGKI